jgi:thiol-disulfide isomerase/thioredoxin
MPLLKSIVAALLLSSVSLVAASTYKVGDQVSDFSLIARQPFSRPDGTVVNAGDPVQLSDLAGRVIFLEWFAVWCPFCVAAAPQVDKGIADYYVGRGGNSHGVPVLHIAVNQEPRSNYRTATDNFVRQQGFEHVVNDYNSTSTNRVRFSFQNGGQPTFAVINGVTNSPSHKPWELLVNHLGYGQTDFSQLIISWRALIDQVQPAPAPLLLSVPALQGDEGFGFQINVPVGQTARIESTMDLHGWETLGTIPGSPNQVTFRDTNAPSIRRYYRAVIP